MKRYRILFTFLLIFALLTSQTVRASEPASSDLLFTFKTWIQEDEKYEYGLARVDTNGQEQKNLKLEQEYYLIDSDEGSVYAVSTPAPDTVSLWEYQNGELNLLYKELNLPDLSHVIAYKEGYLYYHTNQKHIRRVNEQMDRYEYPESISTYATVAISPDGKVACYSYSHNIFCVQMPDGSVIDLSKDLSDHSLTTLAWLDENTLLYWEYSRRFLNVTDSWLLKKYDIVQRKSENFLTEKGKKIRLDEKYPKRSMTLNSAKNTVAFFTTDASLPAKFVSAMNGSSICTLFTLDLRTGAFQESDITYDSYDLADRICILWDD